MKRILLLLSILTGYLTPQAQPVLDYTYGWTFGKTSQTVTWQVDGSKFDPGKPGANQVYDFRSLQHGSTATFYDTGTSPAETQLLSKFPTATLCIQRRFSPTNISYTYYRHNPDSTMVLLGGSRNFWFDSAATQDVPDGVTTNFGDVRVRNRFVLTFQNEQRMPVDRRTMVDTIEYDGYGVLRIGGNGYPEKSFPVARVKMIIWEVENRLMGTDSTIRRSRTERYNFYDTQRKRLIHSAFAFEEWRDNDPNFYSIGYVVWTFQEWTPPTGGGSFLNEMSKPAPLVYPNPATDNACVYLSDELSDEISVTLSDVTGKQIQVMAKNNGDGRYMMGISALPKGIYIVHLEGYKPTKLIIYR